MKSLRTKTRTERSPDNGWQIPDPEYLAVSGGTVHIFRKGRQGKENRLICLLLALFFSVGLPHFLDQEFAIDEHNNVAMQAGNLAEIVVRNVKIKLLYRPLVQGFHDFQLGCFERPGVSFVLKLKYVAGAFGVRIYGHQIRPASYGVNAGIRR